MSFSITPVTGSPPPVAGDFPRFLQIQLDGADVGDTSVETLNFVGNVNVTLSTDGSTATVDVGAGFAWAEVAGDHTLALADMDSGLRTTGNSGGQVITIPSDGDIDFESPPSIVVFQHGAAPVSFVPSSGVQLLVRDGLLAQTAGQYSTATLMWVEANTWTLCGDLASG